MSNKSSNNNSVNSSRVNSGSGHSGSRGNSSRGHSRNNSGNNLGNLIKQSKVNVANTNLTSPNTPGTADNSEKEKDKKTASNYDPSDAITSLINNMDHLNIEKAIPDNSLMVTSTMIEELFNMFTNDVMKLLVHENTHKDDIFGNTEIPLALDDYGDPIPVIVEKTPEQLENEKMLADKLNILKQKVNEKVIRCMDEHLTQSRNSLLFHRKKIQDKLFLTRESLVLSKDVTDRAQSHLHNESLRIVRATLQDRFNAELDVKNAEIKELTYNNRILNQKITECMEENMKHVGSIAELQLKLAPFIKGVSS